MAKLSAHGTELARVSHETATPDGDLTIWERETLSFRSDGHIMRKHDVRFKGDRYSPAGRFHSYGWKLWKRFNGATTMARSVKARECIPGFVERRKARGWTVDVQPTYPRG